MKKSIRITLITITVLFCITAVVSMKSHIGVSEGKVSSIYEPFDILSKVHVMSGVYEGFVTPLTVPF